MNLVQRAKPDSIWQLVMLAGIAERVKLHLSCTLTKCPPTTALFALRFEDS